MKLSSAKIVRLIIHEILYLTTTKNTLIKFVSYCMRKNVGAMDNDVQTWQACQGEYIVCLEGDDYWISPYKLQKQVDFLDNNPEFSACFHPVKAFYEDGSKKSSIFPSHAYRRELFLKDLLGSCIIHTSALMWRHSLSNNFPDWYFQSNIGDWEGHIFLAQQGRIGYIDEIMSTYRIHREGLYQGAHRCKKIEDRIGMLKNLNSYLEFRYKKIYKRLFFSVLF